MHRRLLITNYQLPNGLIKVRRRWGQRHPQGANPNCHKTKKLLFVEVWTWVNRILTLAVVLRGSVYFHAFSTAFFNS
jgi:hypothetical protein